MIKDQCISITDLRTKTKDCIDGAEKAPQYVFINNKPVAVLLNIDEYENNFIQHELKKLPKDQIDEKLLKEAEEARNAREEDFVNI